MTSVPADPADLYVHVYDQIPDEAFSVPDRVAAWLTEPRARSTAKQVEREVLRGGDLGVFADLLGDADHAVPVLVGIERALARALPSSPLAAPDALVDVAARYLATGQLNSEESEGALIARYAWPRASVAAVSRRDFFVKLLRVGADEWARCSHGQIPPASDIYLGLGEDLTVACVPMLGDVSELRFEVKTLGGGRFFRCDPEESTVLERIVDVLTKLDDSGASIGVLPELTLSSRLLEDWKRIVGEYQPPVRSRLQWLILGSGPCGNNEPPPNRAIMIDRRTGRELVRQDKVKPFTLDPSQLEEWRLTAMLGAEPIQEYIAAGSQLCIVESRVGRVSVLICEDLSRTAEAGGKLLAHGVSLVFSPVFSKPVQDWRWEHMKARDLALEIGTTTVVSNSLVVANLQECPLPTGTSIAVSPSGYNLGELDRPDAVHVFKVDLSPPTDDTSLD